jgi:hypothetical protein
MQLLDLGERQLSLKYTKNKASAVTFYHEIQSVSLWTVHHGIHVFFILRSLLPLYVSEKTGSELNIRPDNTSLFAN